MGCVANLLDPEQERPWLHRQTAWTLVPDQDAVLALPMDVEDLARLGRRKGTCPYYAARARAARGRPRAAALLLAPGCRRVRPPALSAVFWPSCQAYGWQIYGPRR